jgi:branched-chain amino acid transport system ATP-binding protein
LADELSFGLAPLIVSRLMDVITDIARSGGSSSDRAVHDDRAQDRSGCTLDHGVIRFDGSPAEIKDNPGILHAAFWPAILIRPDRQC